MALTLCINVYKYTSHLASSYIPDAPPTGPKLKGKRQQRDGQIDLGFAPNTPPMCWVWRQGGKGGALGWGLGWRCKTRNQRPDCQGLSAASEARRPTSGSRLYPPLFLPVAVDLSPWAAGGWTRTARWGSEHRGAQAREETCNGLE